MAARVSVARAGREMQHPRARVPPAPSNPPLQQHGLPRSTPGRDEAGRPEGTVSTGGSGLSNGQGG
jgi:hypothetical protein